MVEQVLDNEKEEVGMAPDKSGTPIPLFQRLKNAVSTNIGLYEIRLNIFLWSLFRADRQKGH